MIGLKYETHFAQGNKTPHQKPGCDHQRERKRNLQDDDCVAEFSVTETAAEALAGVAQGLVQIFSGGLERGDEAESQGRQHGHAQSKISTGAFKRMTASAGIMSCGISATMNFKPPQASSAPRMAPPSASIKLSTRSWRIKRLRLAA